MRLVIASNRLPFTASFKDGKAEYRRSGGGLATGLSSYLERRQAEAGKPGYLWMGWPGAEVPPEHQAQVREYAKRWHAAPVFLSDAAVEGFYHGFCNQTIWPLFHYFGMLAKYREEDWRTYQDVNRQYADELFKVLQPDDQVWVHDYQLMLLPRLIRERFPDMSIGFFLHIPFPSYELFRLLPHPWRTELINGMLGASLVGFHTHDYTRDFLTSVLRTVGYEHSLGTLTLPDRMVKVDTFPMGVDYERFADAAASDDASQRADEVRARCEGRKLIFSVDRLDYTKGLINRLRGYELFLERNPQWHEKVVFMMSVAPSRVDVEDYQHMKEELEQLVGRIIGAYGNVRWTPLIYQCRNLSFDEIVPLYKACDVALITPLRDGMNLVAKEFVASRTNRTGVLVLSEMAGAVQEMGEALVINPYHGDDFVWALERALQMPEDEQVRRNGLMQERLQRYDVRRWAGDFVQALVSTERTEAARRARLLAGTAHDELMLDWRRAGTRALLLDYDGTLVPFRDRPGEARPDAELLELLANLAGDTANRLVVISGRPRADLEAWFGDLPIALIAEHGVWLRDPGRRWRMLRPMDTDWQDSIRPILQMYVDRLPGAMLEQKEFSLAWHYRSADPELASLRARELMDDLANYTRNVDVQVLEGNKVIEIRNGGVTKGNAALEWLGRLDPDFILGVGDDWTDEDMFRALPEGAHSIRVGLANTCARYHLHGHGAVRRLLQDLGDAEPLTLVAPMLKPAAAASGSRTTVSSH